MKKLGAIVLLLALAATSCSRKQPSQAQAESARAQVSQPQTAATDMPQPAAPIYPRATLVALPGQPIPPPAGMATSTPAPDTSASAMYATNPPPASTPVVTPSPATLYGAWTNTAPAMDSGANAMPDVITAATNAVPADTGAMTNAGAIAIPAATPPPLDNPDDNVQVVVLQTTFGRVVIQLDDFAAPKTCANFRNLVSSGFYNGTIFHRVIPHFIIQGGDPNSKTDNRATYGQGDPGYTLPPEIKLSHDRGAVAMARLPDTVNPARDSNGSQFYICVEACPTLDDQYTVFGHVLEGMDVVERISNVPRDSRDDPLVRIEMEARLEQKSQALQETTTTNH